jgi:phospholipid/cholesterol/gamma-HCH transport system substrate-binding protein
MNKTTRLIFVIAVLLIVGGIYFYSKSSYSKTNHTYYGYYDDVQGLAEGSPVHLRGVNIGKVTGIEFERERIRVTFTVKKEYPLTAGSSAALVSGNSLLDNKSILINTGTETNLIPDGAVIPTSVDPSVVENFAVVAAPAIKSAQEILDATDSGLSMLLQLMNTGMSSKFIDMIIQMESQSRGLSEQAGSLKDKSDTFSDQFKSVATAVNSFNASRIDSIFKGENARRTVFSGDSLGKQTVELKNSISKLRQELQQLNQSATMQDKTEYEDLSRSVDSITTSIRELEKKPPGITILGGKKKK